MRGRTGWRARPGSAESGGESFYFFEQTLWGEEPPLVSVTRGVPLGVQSAMQVLLQLASPAQPELGESPCAPRISRGLSKPGTEKGAVNLNLIGAENRLSTCPRF